MRKWVLQAERRKQEITEREIERLIQFSQKMMIIIAFFSVACIGVVTAAAIFAR